MAEHQQFGVTGDVAAATSDETERGAEREVDEAEHHPDILPPRAGAGSSRESEFWHPSAWPEGAHSAGGMLWLKRNALVGSQRALIAASRRYRSAPKALRTVVGESSVE